MIDIWQKSFRFWTPHGLKKCLMQLMASLVTAERQTKGFACDFRWACNICFDLKRQNKIFSLLFLFVFDGRYVGTIFWLFMIWQTTSIAFDVMGFGVWLSRRFLADAQMTRLQLWLRLELNSLSVPPRLCGMKFSLGSQWIFLNFVVLLQANRLFIIIKTDAYLCETILVESSTLGWRQEIAEEIFDKACG
jgi:hypothetical protein